MQPNITIGLDIAKHVFQVHAVDAAGAIVIRRKLRRSELLPFFEGLEPCLVGIEACATAHHWARSITACGHTVKLMPPAYVKPYGNGGVAENRHRPPQQGNDQAAL
jgi:transposase